MTLSDLKVPKEFENVSEFGQMPIVYKNTLEAKTENALEFEDYTIGYDGKILSGFEK